MFRQSAIGRVSTPGLNYGATPIYMQLPRGIDPYLDYRGLRYGASDIVMMSDSPARVQAILRSQLSDPHLIGAKMILITHRDRSLAESIHAFHGRCFGYFAILAVTEADEVIALQRKTGSRAFGFGVVTGTPF